MIEILERSRSYGYEGENMERRNTEGMVLYMP